MSNSFKFQLPPIRGTEVFPQTMQAPTVVRSSIEFNVAAGDEAVSPQILEDYSRQFIADNLGDINHFLVAQRQNFLAGVTEFNKVKRSFSAYDVSYVNIQNNHEILTINMRYDVRRKPSGKVPEVDPLMMLVLYDSNKIAAIPMSALDNLSSASVFNRTLTRSSWDGRYQYYVNQLRISNEYSALLSEIGLKRRRLEETYGSAIIVHDNPKRTLTAYVDDIPVEASVLNGADTAFYSKYGNFTYSPDDNTLTYTDVPSAADAVSAGGQRYFRDTETEYLNNIVNWNTDGEAVEVDVARAVMTEQKGSAPSSYSGTQYRYEYSGPSYLDDTISCQDVILTPVPIPVSGGGSIEFTQSRTWDGISLGSISVSSKTFSDSFTSYLVTQTISYAPTNFNVTWFDEAGVYTEVYTSDGGTRISMSVAGSPPESYSESQDCSDCWAAGVTCLDYCARPIGPGIICASEDATKACANRQLELFNTLFCGTPGLGDCICAKSISSSAITSTSTATVPVLSGELGSAGMINELPALEGQKYYEIYFRPITTTYTPYGTFTQELGDFSGGLSGFWNLANGYHVLQAYTWGENEMYIYLDAQRIDATLAGLIGTTPMSINAIFMDIHLSKVLEFN